MSETETLTTKSLGGLKVNTVIEQEPYTNLLVYGDPGVGKTVLAGSASEVEVLSPVLYLDIEGGTLALRKRYPNVDVIRVRSFDELGKVYTELRQGKSGYKTVVVDSLTEAQKFGMYSIMEAAVKKDSDRDPDLPGIGEWGKNTEQIRRFVRAFRDLPMNTIFICLAATEVAKNGNRKEKPSLSAKLSNEIAGFLDIVLYMYLKQNEDDQQMRLVCSLATDSVVAKDRTDQLPPVLEEPTMKAIYGYITGDGNE